MITSVEEIVSWYWEHTDYVNSDLKGALVVYCVYERESYEGSALVIYIRTGRMYVVQGGHCSCNGMVWEPEQTTPEKLLRADRFYAGERDQIEQALAIYVGQFQ